MNRNRLFFSIPVLIALTLSLFLSPPAVEAAKYPSKPIRLIVPVGAGGGLDLHARAVASVIHQYLGQPMVVQLMPGGGGKIGLGAVMRAKPDGYTIAMGGAGHITIGPHVRDMGYDPLNDFVPLFQIDFSDYILFTRADKPWKNFDEFVEAARKNPGKVSFGSSGIYGQGHLMILKIANVKGIDIKHIPFRGGGPGMAALLGGHTDSGAGLPSTGGALGQVKAGRLRALAVATEKRNRFFPNTPTLREKGVDLVIPAWRTLLVRKGTPQDRIDILVGALKKLAKDKTFKRLLSKMGEKPLPLSGAALSNNIRKEYKEMGAIFKSIGLKKKK